MAHSKDKEIICRIEELDELQCLEIEPQSPYACEARFVVKKNGAIYAYANSCPHTGAPLNWQQNQFLDFYKTHILCTMHGARFQISDGLCIQGPCIGQRLKKFNTEIHDGRIYCTLPTKPQSKLEPGSTS